MTTRSSISAVMLAISLLAFVGDPVFAQTKKKYVSKSGTSKYTQTHVIEVGDVPNHQLRLFELHTVWAAEAPEFDGVKIKERFARAVSDYIDGSGNASGYAINMLENGDKVFEKFTIMAQTQVAADGSRKLGYRTVSTLTGGTGRFTGIRGTLLGGGGSDLKTGITDAWTEGEYWMEK
jgi:hypothetical protein